MSTEQQSAPQGDKLLWVLGGVVALVAVAFFAFMNTGTVAPETDQLEAATAPDRPMPSDEAVPGDAGVAAEAVDYSVRLNRAALALDAGMLVEPAGYSAWSIYSEVLDLDPDNEQAADGLARAAERIVDAAYTDLNAGRREAAERAAELVLTRFADHSDAAEIVSRARREVVANAPVAESAPVLEQAPVAAAATAAPEPAAQPPAAQPPEPVDPIPEIYSRFTAALAQGRLLEPEDTNARTLLTAMNAEDAQHAMTQEAGQQLFEALFEQHTAAFNALDTQAALSWLDAAADLQIDPERTQTARDQILDFVAVQSATEPVSAGELTISSYVAPDYPSTALRRGLEGWVDVAFVLSRDGKPTSVEATDESSSIFRSAATRAVAQWEFEPHTIHDRIVEQHAFTRIRFMLADE